MRASSQSTARKELIDSAVVRHPDIVFTAVGDETVLMGTATGKYYGLDDIGTDIWNRLKAPIAVRELCAVLAAEYAGKTEEIERDVLTLLAQLAADGLIEVRT